MSRRRLRDVVKAEAVGVGELDRFTSFRITSDLTVPSEASFEIGDDGSWAPLERFITNGTKYRVFVNGALRLSGRVEILDVVADKDGSVVRFTIRTKLADAMYASADPRTKVNGVSIKQFLLALYAPLGYAEKDFVFDADVSRNLMTGRSATGAKPPADLEPLREEQAKVNPPEAIYPAADRHLRRFGLMHWDSPDGKIVVGAPDDAQNPTYYFRLLFGSQGAQNNLLSAQRVRDWSEIASALGVFGVGGKWNYSQAQVRSVLRDADVLAAGMHRPVIIQQDAVKTQAQAERAARREVANRSRRKDAWELKTDGLSYWAGDGTQIAYGVDTVCDVVTSVAGGPAGPHLIHRVESTRTPTDGDLTTLFVLKKGLWFL